MKKQLEDIIKDLDIQLSKAQYEDMKDADWDWRHGILIKGDSAEIIVQSLREYIMLLDPR